MTVENDFLAFATGGGANVEDQASYAASSFVTNGFSSGIAQSQQLNKVWRQSSFISAMLSQYIVNQTGSPMVDDGDLTGKVALLASAIQAATGIQPSRIVTVSTALTVLLSDYAIGLDRTVSLTATAVTLPSAAIGQAFVLEDLVGNFDTYPITVSPPGGQSIAGLANYVMNVKRQSSTFRYYGSNLWSVK